MRQVKEVLETIIENLTDTSPETGRLRLLVRVLAEMVNDSAMISVQQSALIITLIKGAPDQISGNREFITLLPIATWLNTCHE